MRYVRTILMVVAVASISVCCAMYHQKAVDVRIHPQEVLTQLMLVCQKQASANAREFIAQQALEPVQVYTVNPNTGVVESINPSHIQIERSLRRACFEDMAFKYPQFKSVFRELSNKAGKDA